MWPGLPRWGFSPQAVAPAWGHPPPLAAQRWPGHRGGGPPRGQVPAPSASRRCWRQPVRARVPRRPCPRAEPPGAGPPTRHGYCRPAAWQRDRLTGRGGVRRRRHAASGRTSRQARSPASRPGGKGGKGPRPLLPPGSPPGRGVDVRRVGRPWARGAAMAGLGLVGPQGERTAPPRRWLLLPWRCRLRVHGIPGLKDPPVGRHSATRRPRQGPVRLQGAWLARTSRWAAPAVAR